MTWTFFNLYAGIRWRNAGGDWIDAHGIPQGTEPFAVTRIADTDTVKDAVWNVTKLVKTWQADPARTTGILLQARSGGTIRFHSNQSQGNEPRLVLSYEGGQTVEYVVPEDASLDPSTTRPHGTAAEGQVSPTTNHILQWHRGTLFDRHPAVTSATLRMISSAQFSHTDVAAYQLSIPIPTDPPPLQVGLAAQYAADAGLRDDPEVVFFEDFRGTLAEVESRWNGAKFTSIDSCDLPRVAQCARASVKGTADGGNGLGGVVGRKILPREMEDAYMRYYIKFGAWAALDAGKLPGLANYDAGDGERYFSGGNGGDPVHGYDGWTLRGSFLQPLGPREPAPGLIPMGTYAYHGVMKDYYGDLWGWSGNHTDLHLIRPGEWHCIEQRVKVNTPGAPDGILEVWIDGRQVLSKKDLFLRVDPKDVPRTYPNGKPVPADQLYWVPGSMGIRKLWANLYHGGKTPATQTLTVHWANFVVATRYIGPMGRAR